MADLIRPYQKSDREALHQIGADTAFFGAPVENYLEDRHIFMDGFYAYYTDYEPEHAWIACSDAKVVGFLTGCTNTTRFQRIMHQKIGPALFIRWIRGQYHTGPKTWKYCYQGLRTVLRREIPHFDLTGYPAHLHINLLPDWRGRGLGRQLIDACLNQMTSLGLTGIHLETTSLNTAAVKLYEKTGFQLLDAKVTTMYQDLVDKRVELRIYGIKLTSRS